MNITCNKSITCNNIEALRLAIKNYPKEKNQMDRLYIDLIVVML
jgi:hypothetical protein